MDEQDEHPELAGYVPTDARPSKRRRRLVMIRVVVTVSVVALLLPGVLTTISVASSTANTTCISWVRHSAPDASGASARFEIFGQGGVGWECYALGTLGGERHVASLGLIPSAATLPASTLNS